MEEIKELLEKQNNLIEFQNKILKEGFEALLRMAATTSSRAYSTNMTEIIKDFRTEIKCSSSDLI